VLHAEAGSVQPDLIDREVVTKEEVLTASQHPSHKGLFTLGMVADILRYIERK
jgi:hypothetical protein